MVADKDDKPSLRDLSEKELKDLIGNCPNAGNGNVKIVVQPPEQLPKQDCVGYALGRDEYLPPGKLTTTIDLFIKDGFKKFDIKKSSECKCEKGKITVAIYALGDQATHAVRCDGDAKWRSKHGTSFLYEIDSLDQLERSEGKYSIYGQVVACLKKDIPKAVPKQQSSQII